MIVRIKKNDTAVVISGKDRGKEGAVMRVDKKKGKVMLKDIAVQTRHVKPRRQGETGGIKKEESYIPLSKVMPVCPTCKKRCRVKAIVQGENAKVRACHRCSEAF